MSVIGASSAGLGTVVASEPGSAKSTDRRSAVNALLAEQRSKSIRDRFDVESVRETIDERASSVLQELAKRDLIAEPSVSALDIDAISPPEVLAEKGHGANVSAIEVDGELTPHVYAVKRTNTHRIGVFVQPEAERAYAIVKPSDDNPDFVVDGSSDDVETQSICETEMYCSGCCCDHGSCGCYTNHVYERECCKESDGSTTCYDGERTGGCC